ncbi:MAG: DUF6367 family protein [Candidatus Kapabacteria bacterium]|nr:DUF6367 family protein [Candidatus Kapabacteria bacterium]
MKTFKEFIKQDNIYNLDYIIIEINKSEKPLIEGYWEQSAENGYFVRLDNPHSDSGKLHVHIAKKKHINTKTRQVSWNDDGTRHDKKSFNNSFVGLEKAKKIARNVLGLCDDVLLEVLSIHEGCMILENSNIENLSIKSGEFIYLKTVT